MKAQKAILRLSRPMLVWCATTAGAAGAACVIAQISKGSNAQR